MATDSPQPTGHVVSEQTPKRTRRRVPVSCNLCHARKLKCNRQKPCSSCEIRGEGSKCIYAPKVSRAEPQTPQRRRLNQKDDELQQRLNNLERMIVDAANGRNGSVAYSNSDGVSDGQTLTSPTLSTENSNGSNGAVGSLETRGRNAVYTGDTAFHSILQELGEMRHIYLETYEEGIPYVENPYQCKEGGFAGLRRPFLALNGAEQDMSREALVQALPSKPMSDGLVNRFFENDDPAIPVTYLLHRKTFMEEYERHCSNPSNTPIVWLGLLYTIMSLSARFYECEVMASSDNYRALALKMSNDFYYNAIQCLDKLDLSRPVAGTIEFLSMFLHTSYFQRQDHSTQIWLLTGDIVRLAMRMGYHRDPARYSHFSPFESEMRRRVWETIVQADLLFSFQLGLPTVVKSDEYDTLPPGNYFEEQLDPKMPALPAEQPRDAPTFISYWIASDLLLRPFRAIVENMNILHGTFYSQVLALSQRLTDGRSQIAPHLRGETADPASNDGKGILKRIQLDQIYHKVMCVLHRKHMAEGLRNRNYRPSTDACIQSALALLRCQEDLHSNEMKLFRQIRWHVFSLTNHDFLLAATILCLYLTLIDRSGIHALTMAAAQDGQPAADRAIIEAALTRSGAIWSEVRDTSEEARKAYNILETTLSSVRNQEPVTDSQQVTVDPAIESSQAMNGSVSDAFGLDPGFDWDSWDSYFRDQESIQASFA